MSKKTKEPVIRAESFMMSVWEKGQVIWRREGISNFLGIGSRIEVLKKRASLIFVYTPQTLDFCLAESFAKR